MLDQFRTGVTYRARRQTAAIGTVPRRVGAMVRNPLGVAQEAVQSAVSAARMLRPVSEPMGPVMAARSLSVRFDALGLPASDEGGIQAGRRPPQ